MAVGGKANRSQSSGMVVKPQLRLYVFTVYIVVQSYSYTIIRLYTFTDKQLYRKKVRQLYGYVIYTVIGTVF